jgi:NLR family CARD domain-containing protein 3
VNTTVTSLDLDRNNLGKDAGQALAEALRVNTTVTSLDLDRNNLGKDAG